MPCSGACVPPLVCQMRVTCAPFIGDKDSRSDGMKTVVGIRGSLAELPLGPGLVEPLDVPPLMWMLQMHSLL